MTAPASATTFTDDELKALKPDEIDVLTDEEVNRLYALQQEPTERKTTEAQIVSAGPPKDPTYIDPLAGKPTLPEFERSKMLADTPRVGLPTTRTPAPPLPSEGPTDLKSFLQSIGTAIGSGADRVTEQPQPDVTPPNDATLTDPAKAEAVTAQKQQSLIAQNQGVQTLGSGNAPDAEVPGAVLGQIGRGVITETIASMSEFVANPLRQLAERPIEFGGNVLQAGLWLRGAKAAVGALREAPEAIDAAAAAIRRAPPEEILGAQTHLEEKLDQIDTMKDMNRQLGNDPEYAARLRALEKDIEDTKQTIDKLKAPVVEPEIPAEPPIEWPKEAQVPNVSESTETAKATVHLTDVLSTAPAGALILAGAARDDKTDPTPKVGSPLAWKNALWAVPAGVFAFGVARYFQSPEVRAALKQFTRIDKSRPADLERVFETVLAPMFPDTPADGLQRLAPGLGTAAGAGVVGLVGSQYGQDEVSPGGAVAGLLAGAALGSVLGSNFAKQFRMSLTYRQLYKMYFTEAAGMSASAVAAKQATRIALEGRIREIKDVSNELASFDTQTRSIVQAWMSGNANLAAVPVHAREAAAHGRLLFDELTMDLLKSGLVDSQVLKDTLTTNMGTYVPRLLLRYELDNGPREAVESWLRGQGKGWGYISSKNYLKHKANIPANVLASLGEITDNPGYLLAKRGTITAADIEQARYHNFIASSPENSIPAAVLATKGPQAPQIFTSESGFKAAKWNDQTYWKMPENARYGALQGKFVEQAVASDIISTHETTSGLSKLFAAPLSTFKFFKAVFNPASQFRNMVTNAIFADIEAGVPPWRMDKWGRSANELRTGGKWYREARRDGVFGGEFSVAEITGLLDPSKNYTSVMDHIGDIPMYAGKPAEFFMRWHQTSEAHARLTVYMHAVETLGLDGPAASAFARRTIPDYQDVQRWVKVVRQSPFGAPFISFSYKAIPRSLEAAFAFGDPKKMMRFWKYPFAMAALNEYSAQKFGLLGKDEKDKTDIFNTLRRVTLRGLSAGTYSPNAYDTYRKYLPNHVGNMQITVPWRDQYDRPQYLDGTFFLPWGDAGEMGKGDFAKGTGLAWFPRQLEPSNPWFQLGVAAVTGKDSFTGREIIPAGAVGAEAMTSWAKFLVQAWGPSLTPGAGFSAQALKKSFTGAYANDPNVKSKGTAIASELFGARTRPVDPASSYRFRVFDLRADLDKNRSEIIRLAKDLAATDEVSSATVQKLRASNPSKALIRALNRREAILKTFQQEYPADEIPPSPEKLLKAIQKQGKK